MVEVGPIIYPLSYNVVAGLIVALIVALVGWFYSSKIRSFLLRALNYLFDTKIQADLVRVDRYDTPPMREVDMEIFQEIQEVSSSVTFDALADNILRIQGPSLPTPIEIRIEEEPAIEGYPTDESRYEVRINTYPSLTFGYRSDSPLLTFEALSNQISSVLRRECFDDAEPVLTFIEGEITDHIHTNRESVEIPKLDLRAQIHDDKVHLTIEEPRYLQEGIRRFIRPRHRA